MFHLALILFVTVAAGCAPLLRPVARWAWRTRYGAEIVGLAAFTGVWLVSTIILTHMAAYGLYQLASYYSASTLGTATNVTQVEASQMAEQVVMELWVRELIRPFTATECFAPESHVCALADAASTLGTGIFAYAPLLAAGPAALALLGALLSLRLRTSARRTYSR